MIRRLSAFAIAVALSWFAAVPGRAETASFDLGLVRPGMPLADLRHAAWPAGSRLLCGGDADLPANLLAVTHDGIVLPDHLVKQGLTVCALFAPKADGTWESKTTDFGGAPARLWLLALTEKAGGEARLVQAKLWQDDAAFKTTVAFVTSRLGPADFVNEHGARWNAVDSEAIIGHLSAGGISTILTDKRLEAVVNERMSEGKPKAKP